MTDGPGRARTRKEEAPPLADASSLRKAPLTARGARTRAALVAAARVVFERDGYLDARLSDITAEADCSSGTFYTYFSSKEEIFQAVIDEAQHDLLHPGLPHVSAEESSPAAVIEASNRAYFMAYQRNAKLQLVLDEVAASDAKFREVRQRRSQAFLERNARAIEELQNSGHVDKTLDPVIAARALSSMVARLAYYSYALEENYPLDKLVDTTTKLWVNALNIQQERTGPAA